MRLTRHTDYAMRVLIDLASDEAAPASIAQIADRYGISQNHLMKVVHGLGKAGFIATMRGRSGGIRLARPAREINLGAVVRHTEDGFDLVDCATCVIARACGLPSVLNEATAAFLAVLDKYSLADIAARRSDLRLLLGIEPEPA